MFIEYQCKPILNLLSSFVIKFMNIFIANLTVALFIIILEQQLAS
jgi:hypothetical protein